MSKYNKEPELKSLLSSLYWPEFLVTMVTGT